MIRHVYRVPTCTGIYVHVRTLGIMEGLLNLHVLLAALGIYYVNENKSLLMLCKNLQGKLLLHVDLPVPEPVHTCNVATRTMLVSNLPYMY